MKTIRNKKRTDVSPFLFFGVGAAGFEPAISWSQTRRLNRAGPRPDAV